MAFKLTAEDLKKSAKCPVGMHLATLVVAEEPYISEKGNETQKCDFETDQGYTISKWFNEKFTGDLFEFVAAADKIKFDATTFKETEIELKNYRGKKVAISVSHGKDKNGKVQANIDNFFSADKIPF